MSIPHIDDLTIEHFLNLLKNINNCEFSEKIDGSYLQFGFDKDGSFYTSRENKNGERYYYASDYGDKEWAVPFKECHTALENSKNIIFSKIGLGSSVDCEILFGKKPNTIPYNLDINYVVVFDEEIGKKLKSVNKDLEKHCWKISYTKNHTISDTKVSNFIEQIETYLTNCSGIKNLKNKEILQIKLNKCPDELTRTEFRDLKQQIKKTRENILQELETMKQEVKEYLLDELVRNRTSEFSDNCPFIEGIVIHSPNGNVKIVDKEIFTLANKFNYLIRNKTKDKVWLKFKKDVEQAVVPEQTFDYYMKHLLSIEKAYNKNRKKLKLRIQKGSIDTVLEYDDETHQRTITYIDSTKRRMKEIMEQKKEKLKTFGSKADKIKLDDIYYVLNLISGMTKIPYEELQNNLLGSAGKKKMSGDIDIAIDKNEYFVGTVKNMLGANIKEENIKYSAGLDILHVLFPYKDKFVQVDFIFTEDIQWTKFAYYSPGDQSKYKGAYRAMLLSSVASSGNETTYDGDELIARKGWVWVPRQGLTWQLRQRTKTKNNQYTKNFKVMHKGEVINEPNKVAETLFGNDVSPNDLKTVEGIYKLIYKYFDEKRIEKILKIFKERIKDSGLEIPKELF